MKIYYELPKVSTNQYYTGMHWSQRNKIAKKYHNDIYYLCKKNNLPKVKESCKIIFGFATKFDLDNNSIIIKMIIDSLRYGGIIKDDNKKYVKGIEIKIADENYFEIIESD